MKYRTVKEQLSRMKELSGIKEEKYRKKLQLSESGYSRLMQIMRGVVPSIKTIGIITAENPYGQTLSTQENKKRNEKLENNLKNLNYGFHKIKGRYNKILENPFFVPNIKKEDLIKLGENYEQKSVIYGEKIENCFNFYFIEGDEETGRKVFCNLDNPEDAYSDYNGRKFIIPFFDEMYKEAEWDGGKISFKKEELPLTEEINELLEIIKENEKDLLLENKTEKHYWEYRGIVKVNIIKLNNILIENENRLF